MEFNREKFKNMVHYICRRTATTPEKLGKTKLHKIVWFSEAKRFMLRGEKIIGERYVKKPYGPFAYHMEEIIKELSSENKLFQRKADYYGMEQIQLIGKGEPNLSLFSPDELQLIDETLEDICEGHTASSISDKTHGMIWQIAADEEPIPIETVLVAQLAPITNADIDWAKAEIAKIG